MNFKTLILGGILLSVNGYAQNFTGINTDNHQIVYRGFNNNVTVNQIGCNYDNYSLETKNCSLTMLEDKNGKYILKTKSGAEFAKIYIVSNKVRIDSLKFAIKNLPVPQIYWGYNTVGEPISESNEIMIKYHSGIPIKSSFHIESWECDVKEKKFEGEGSTLSNEFMEFIKSIPDNESVRIVVIYTGEDGIKRKMGGVWTKV